VSAARLILGISTSGPVEVAALDDSDRAVVVCPRGQALESLLVGVEQVLDEFHASLDDIGLIAVCIGPGSFTGLRIGVAFAKSLAQARSLPVLGIAAYDVAEFDIQQFPRIAVAAGKRNYYYGRVTIHAAAAPEFIQGDKALVQQAAERLADASGHAATIAGTDFSTFAPGERARRVAQLGRRARAAGRASGWRDIVIDYGQRPNAVINWERRGARAQEGQAFERRELSADEGPAAPA